MLAKLTAGTTQRRWWSGRQQHGRSPARAWAMVDARRDQRTTLHLPPAAARCAAPGPVPCSHGPRRPRGIHRSPHIPARRRLINPDHMMGPSPPGETRDGDLQRKWASANHRSQGECSGSAAEIWWTSTSWCTSHCSYTATPPHAPMALGNPRVREPLTGINLPVKPSGHRRSPPVVHNPYNAHGHIEHQSQSTELDNIQ